MLIDESCTLHKFKRAIFSRKSMVYPDDRIILMCDDCRDKLLELFDDKIFDTLNVERI